MTSPLPGPISPEPNAGGRVPPSLPLLAAAGLVAIVTVVLVATFGISRPPSLPSVDATTRPDRALALFGFDDEGNCLDVLRPDGELVRVRCGFSDHGPLVSFDDEGIGLGRYDRVGMQLEMFDPTTGEVIARRPLDPDARMWPAWENGSVVTSDRIAGVLRVRDEDQRVIWEVEAPEGYRIDGSIRDRVDGRLAMFDSAGRILVMAEDATEPSVWGQVGRGRYLELLWEGTPPPAQ
jgi:hypothetical protein